MEIRIPDNDTERRHWHFAGGMTLFSYADLLTITDFNFLLRAPLIIDVGILMLLGSFCGANFLKYVDAIEVAFVEQKFCFRNNR